MPYSPERFLYLFLSTVYQCSTLTVFVIVSLSVSLLLSGELILDVIVCLIFEDDLIIVQAGLHLALTVE